MAWYEHSLVHWISIVIVKAKAILALTYCFLEKLSLNFISILDTCMPQLEKK